ncbi:Glutamine--fructose-6-phosphate aminotransferase [isomerizing] [Curvibacter sp. AEP1-3]|uniref:glucosamine 6-phosphate synthetase n=1 Tax=Curvibacter sp. AEP1-3 TaxID=1844971 RepID=UPI000B3C9765|nr:glucosamine 6-phosphate synthetase [Curvibacter sp. AEP1-3]ARV20035.1 Glutamine--fructose-6-phosphate aminotransferase [isomerizing] [Curvibacter sp. AEP1-3]
MCGIFGVISSSPVLKDDLGVLVKHAQQRGRDSSGLVTLVKSRYQIYRADYPISRLLSEVQLQTSNLVLGHSRLITNGLGDNQPVVRDDIAVLHNGIVVNDEAIWPKIGKERKLQVDTEVIAGIASAYLDSGKDLTYLPDYILGLCRGVVACALILPKLGKLCLFSNNGSLYVGRKGGSMMFASERYPLVAIGCEEIEQARKAVFIDIPVSDESMKISDQNDRQTDLIPSLSLSSSEEKLLEYRKYEGRRCTKCLLTETMPFIKFDSQGVCNYCKNYKPRNKPRPKEDLFTLVESYRRANTDDCLVPFSGGRDSCYGLHLIVNELKMKPITYTYDWGMVTDLGRRNISRMSAELGVENIIVADDIALKRRNIAKNLNAWLKSPHLGMMSVLTAGDKHFFRHIETVKKQTGIGLNLWGVNPLEVTHFKAGFLGVPPDFEEERVYSHGGLKQLRYQYLRFKAMLESPSYFNSSLWDTLSGEYYRSFAEKTDYFHIFDYWRWDEKQINDTLDAYGWERAPDTTTTWRIGDGTAAFYNYVYYTVAGFTEHDTFRSNQIREGDLTREQALELVMVENTPRYPNIKWYLDALGMDFKDVVSVVNAIPKMY